MGKPIEDHWSIRSDGMSYNEIAKELDMTPGQVRHIVKRALMKLRMKTIAIKMKREDHLEK